MSGNTSKSQNKTVDETKEVLDAIGHENEKEGIRWTKHFMDEWDKNQLTKKQERKQKLEKSRRGRKISYFRVIAGMLQEELSDLDIPLGYRTWAEFSGDGVSVKLLDIKGRRYARGFKPSGDYEVDFNAVVGLLVDVQNSVDILEQEPRENLSKMGIILPS